MRSQRGSSLFRIAVELRDELLGTSEFHSIAETADELDANRASVEVAGCLEEVDFETDPRVAERRTRSEVHHPPESGSLALDSHGVHSVRRKQLAV
jgi:hypothetical protein